ncbi:uncharacterized protein LOC124929379 [Impatiens glandulifera]|uniref:uncharacterized protein LOC124929379 n=1 Tax=Impatiens glandulifera TaxID=253017 RepID=UPI001FB07E03|nr:uncharacterized protein LOC124929379 [Impatiens glandulifera]
MGASASSEQGSPEQKEAESLAASLGALPMLKKAFSLLAAADDHDPQSNSIPIVSLQQLFTFKSHQKSNSGGGGGGLKNFDQLLTQLGPSIVDHFFLANANDHDHDHDDKGDGITYVQFLRGYVKCCGRSSTASSFNNLFRILTAAVTRAGLPPKLEFESEDTDYKMSGSFTPHDILLFLSLCWIMSFDSKTQQQEEEVPALPDLDHLLLSAVESCSEESNNETNSFWNCDLDLDLQLSAGKVLLWALKTTPNLADCTAQFVHGRLQKSVEDKSSEVDLSSEADDSSSSSNLLTKGMVWAISLTLTSTLRQEILKAFLPSSNNADDGNNYDRLIYRSSVHGKGMNRFWSNVEGYNGPTLIILAARFEDDDDNDNDGVTSKRCIVGVLTNQGFENKDTYYGSQGSLYAISPAFHVFSSHGKDKNFVYTHLHPTGRVYEPHPKPVGIAFGGSIGGNERIFIDEDFAKVTFRHHAVDKTYQHGPLFPGQGFLAVEAVVSEVEVWGLGGSHARKFQNSFKQREELFTNQRRKVDLKTFGNWEDSPEKMMMDMISDPNHVRREER